LPLSEPGKPAGHLPCPVMLKEPPPAKIPPPETDPEDKAPVVKLTEPRSVPFADDAEKLPNEKFVACDPFELIVDVPTVPSPAVPDIPETAIVPVWLVVETVSAHAAIGNTSASRAITLTTRLMFIPSSFRFP
jgi:hypothetical protein